VPYTYLCSRLASSIFFSGDERKYYRPCAAQALEKSADAHDVAAVFASGASSLRLQRELKAHLTRIS
jgi:hypothetical protein